MIARLNDLIYINQFISFILFVFKEKSHTKNSLRSGIDFTFHIWPYGDFNGITANHLNIVRLVGRTNSNLIWNIIALEFISATTEIDSESRILLHANFPCKFSICLIIWFVAIRFINQDLYVRLLNQMIMSIAIYMKCLPCRGFCSVRQEQKWTNPNYSRRMLMLTLIVVLMINHNCLLFSFLSICFFFQFVYQVSQRDFKELDN